MAITKLASPSSSSLLLVWFLVAVLLSQSMAMSMTFEDQKNYYPPAPHAGSGSPPSGSGSHGGHGHHHGAPPENCGSPPVDPGTPSTPSPHVPTPSTPSPHVPTPSTPSPHVPTPSTPSPHVPTPSTPSPHVPTPSAPSGGGSPPTPIIVGTPPSAPGIPGITPTPPFLPTTPGTCYYWLTHPHLIWGVVGWWGTIGNIFNLHHSVPGILPSLTLQQALSNTRTDGLGALFREGTASMLNSMVSNKFPFTTQQVRDSFVSALSSDSAAATQARFFKLANEGRLKPRA